MEAAEAWEDVGRRDEAHRIEATGARPESPVSDRPMTAGPMLDAGRAIPAGRPEFRGASLGAKFVGLTAGLILLLSVTALISLRTSSETARQFKSVVDVAIPAYGALARSHIRSLEQGLELRRALLDAEDAAAADNAVAGHVRAFLAAQAGFEREIADALQMLQDELDDPPTKSTAARIRPLLDRLLALRRLAATYQREAGACLRAIGARSLPQARRSLARVDELRDTLNGRLEGLRAGLFATLQTMSREAQAAQGRARLATVVVFVLSSILGLGVAAIGAVRLIRAIRSLVRGAEAVEHGDLETRIEIASRDEFGRLAVSFNRMTEGLRMRDRIRDMFGRYVDRRIAEQLIEQRSQLGERGDRREVAVLFCDLADFTALSERVAAEQLVQFLNSHFSIMAEPIAATDGIIDKYIGDAVMAYWCPPFVAADQVALRAAEAAVRCLEQVPLVAAAARTIFGASAPDYIAKIRIGIASGQSITGSIGAEQRRNYTVIGDPVNLASRLEAANRLYGTSSLVCGWTAEIIGRQFELRRIDSALLPGIDAPQPLFEILGRAGDLAAGQRELRTCYEGALANYRRGEFEAAGRGFVDCLALAPADGPSRTMLKRIERLAAAPAGGETWTGIWRLSKDDIT
jgi:class 3 adenylate cyclase